MKRYFLLLCLAACFGAAPLSATYSYFQTDSLQNYNVSAPNWNINGTSSNSVAAGLTVTAATGGSYITKTATPDGTNQYEVAATLKLASSGGNYVMYLEATTNALLGSTSVGSFYAVAIQNPTFANGGCTATAVMDKVVNGSVTQVGSTTVPCKDGITYHAVIGTDNAVHFWVNNLEYLWWKDSTLLSGQGGVGGYSMPSGNGIDLAQIGPCDRTVPTAADRAQIQTFALSNRVDLDAGPMVDDANGSGISAYKWYRDGAYLFTTEASQMTDVSATAGANHTYGVLAQDHHGNQSATTSFTVAVPANATIDAVQTGVRPTGTYWGGLGEKVNLRTGNLNYTYPLITAMSRGWSIPLQLSYNSQNWRLDGNNASWKLGSDVGYGFGWRLQIGFITPYYSSYFGISFYEYTDPSGATYRLDQNNNGIWTSKESIYVTYDSNTQRLHFNNGSFWVLGCASAGTEQDAGTLYPTLIQDSNGNQITVQYLAGNGVTWTNSSARIYTIQDVRPGTNPTGAPTFLFAYNSDVIPHLTSISNSINSIDQFYFSYSPQTTLVSPLGSGSFETAAFLKSATNQAVNLTTTFVNDPANTGELQQVTLPLGGHIRWQYQNAAYAQSTVREVGNRYLQWDSSIGERTFAFSHTAGTGNMVPGTRSVVDNTAAAQKTWTFSQTQGPTLGLVTEVQEGTSSTVLRQINYTWAQNTTGNNYLSRTQVISDPGQSYAATKQIDQSVDQYGNLTQTKLYHYSDLTNPAKTYNTTYLTTSGSTDYRTLYIVNRVAKVTLTDKNNVTTTLKQNTFDQYPNGIAATANIQQQDAQDYGTGFTARGNLYDEAYPWGSTHRNYDQTGTPNWVGNDINPNH